MKIAVIGAGISGLSIAKMLSRKQYEVEVFEAKDVIGGIAKTEQVNGVTYHKTGGHCFNSKYQEVLDFVFSIYPAEKWNKVERIAKIYFKERFVSYPIEFSLKEIFEFDQDLVFKIIEDLFAKNDFEPNNLEEWFIDKFGRTLAEEYFIPYNRKIWGKDLSSMSYEWVHDKLPIPNKREIVKSLLKEAKDDMPHAFFYYPKTNDQFDFISALAEGLKIKLNYNIESIECVNNYWVLNGAEKFDTVISTVPMNLLLNLIKNTPDKILRAAEKLEYNKITTMLWEAEPTTNTWTYFPSKDTIFHRHIHIGNFFKPQKNHIITEAMGNVSEDCMIKEGRKFKHLIKPLSYNVSDHAYVVYDENYTYSKKVILDYLNEINLHTLGRFGEWEYYNMDLCIKSSLELVRTKFE